MELASRCKTDVQVYRPKERLATAVGGGIRPRGESRPTAPQGGLETPSVARRGWSLHDSRSSTNGSVQTKFSGD